MDRMKVARQRVEQSRREDNEISHIDAGESVGCGMYGRREIQTVGDLTPIVVSLAP